MTISHRIFKKLGDHLVRDVLVCRLKWCMCMCNFREFYLLERRQLHDSR